MNDTLEIIVSGIIALAIAALLYGLLYLVMEKPWRHLRILCTCGHRERGFRSQYAARTAIETHLQVCRGQAIASPLPAPEIAKAAE